MNFLNETGKASAEPLHWVIDKHSQNCILLKRGRHSIVAVDFDGKNYTVMLDPKKRSSMGCQRATFKDANEMVQRFLNSTIEGGDVPECPSNIRRWLRHGQDRNLDDGIRESDEWEKASSAQPESKFDWAKGSKPGAAYLRKDRKNYIKIVKRIPHKNNSAFYTKWIKDNPYWVEWCDGVHRQNGTPLGWELPDFKSALAFASKMKQDDYSVNGLVFPAMPDDVKEFLKKGRSNPEAEMVVAESTSHFLKWEIYPKKVNRASLVLDGRTEVACVIKNEDQTSDVLPYIVEVYSFTHACEFAGKVKSLKDAQLAVSKCLSSDSAKHPSLHDGVKVPPIPTKVRLWIDQPFDESVLSEKG